MSYTVAVAGKGGVGKTTFSSLIIKHLLAYDKKNILAVDADPNSNLADFLGVIQDSSIVDIIDEVSRDINSIPSGMTKDRYLEYRLNSAIVESQGFDLLAMGRPEGPGCYCYVNNILRTLLKKISDSYAYVVIDNEAGMEHLSRRTTRSADVLFIVTSYTPVGLRSAKRIYDLVKELEIKIEKAYLVVNQVGKREELLDNHIDDLGIEVAGFIPQDKEIMERCTSGRSLLDLPENNRVFEITREILTKLKLAEQV